MALALEFQLGADILATSVAPSWDMLGKLGAIAVLRTALNYFLTREMEQEKEVRGHEKTGISHRIERSIGSFRGNSRDTKEEREGLESDGATHAGVRDAN
jgi:hypothetical protein